MFSMESFNELDAKRSVAGIVYTSQLRAWHAFRDIESSRFAALTIPRVLGRLPYGTGGQPSSGFFFEEASSHPRLNELLWVSAAWSFAACIAGAFARDGWPAAIRGLQGGGCVEHMPTLTYRSEEGGIAEICTEKNIADAREAELTKAGLLPLCHFKNTDYSVFFSSPSCHRPRRSESPADFAASFQSAQLNATLCVSRFVHYIQAISRERIGSFMTSQDMENYLNRWLAGYVSEDFPAGRQFGFEFPLREARVQIQEAPDRPGRHQAILDIKPALQPPELITPLRTVFDLPCIE
jgi:type VI secretion system protein ImpC